MSIVAWEKKETVGIITMCNGENRHNPFFIREIMDSLSQIEADAGIDAVVITSNDPKNWSLGIDLQWLSAAMDDHNLTAVRGFLYDLNRLFARLLLYPMPVVAAINGHAFGNGSILACACDFRLMKADRGYFCFPEINIGIPFLPGMLSIIKKAIPYYQLEELVFTGKKASASELEVHHVISKACTDEKTLLAESLALAATFKKNRTIFGELKKRLHTPILTVMEQEDPAYIEPLRLMV